MAKIQNYEDLEVWQLGIELVTRVYALTKQLPPDERWGLISQLNRASVSVPANIAEGWGRGRTPSQCQFLKIARGSLFEVKTLLVVCKNVYPAIGDQALECRRFAKLLGRMLNAYLTVVSDSVRESEAMYSALESDN